MTAKSSTLAALKRRLVKGTVLTVVRNRQMPTTVGHTRTVVVVQGNGIACRPSEWVGTEREGQLSWITWPRACEVWYSPDDPEGASFAKQDGYLVYRITDPK